MRVCGFCEESVLVSGCDGAGAGEESVGNEKEEKKEGGKDLGEQHCYGLIERICV